MNADHLLIYVSLWQYKLLKGAPSMRIFTKRNYNFNRSQKPVYKRLYKCDWYSSLRICLPSISYSLQLWLFCVVRQCLKVVEYFYVYISLVMERLWVLVFRLLLCKQEVAFPGFVDSPSSPESGQDARGTDDGITFCISASISIFQHVSQQGYDHCLFTDLHSVFFDIDAGMFWNWEIVKQCFFMDGFLTLCVASKLKFVCGFDHCSLLHVWLWSWLV